MNNSTMNFTTPEASTNSTNHLFAIITILDIYIYSFNVFLGFPTHFYIILLIVQGTGNGVASDFFILNLSVSEIGICLNSLFSVFYYFTGVLYLRLLGFLLGLLVTGRPLFQCLICVERYLAVVHPVTFLKYKPLRYRVICCTPAWIICLGSCLCCMFTTEQFNYELYIYFYLIQFLLFFSIQLFCLVTVLRALKQSGPGERGRERKEENCMKRRAFRLILITTVTMTNIYMPLIISGFYFILTQQFIVNLFSVGLLCFILAGFVQPVLYLHRAGKLSCFCCF
ncbi:uracil nucleotide/cysteinyl leukotriene receptor-like [Cyprinus carpio]|uniref:Uracil nucleotide/cysteinyl leukotriene receptor-like n=1 Tax=Cyprinus carpio TaxID=7962 RepID=A0A9Q9XMA0_CYPCA|nr:uracil nucleotide/cysteinyl leukotriene receptor-like [Cyprinus carpio]